MAVKTTIAAPAPCGASPSWATSPEASSSSPAWACSGDWIVDWAFGDVHTRPGLPARERELIIVAVLTALGSSDPQVRAHIRALRAIDVPWSEIEETILQTTPYAGIPRAVNAIKVLREEQEAET